MTKKHFKITVLFLPLLFCTVFILSNSLKNGEQSRRDSDVILEIVETVANKIVPNNNLNWNFIVRKSAHIIEFFGLGVLAMLLFLQFKKKLWFSFISSLSYSVFVASCDEIIQRFTERTSSFTDVMIDTFGAISGICLILLMYYIFVMRRRECGRSVKKQG
ncbi:MAG: VanZ family protein [Clostridia bacterium]|nr:VanZ family protein [Clostridia bacterium]